MNCSKRFSISASGPSPCRMASLTSSPSRISALASPPLFLSLPISPESRFFFSLSRSIWASASRRSRSSETNWSQSMTPPRVARRAFTRSRSSRSSFTSSINFFLRELEGVFDMLDHGLASGPGNTDDVEARIALLKLSLGEKILRGLNHLLLFPERDGFERRAEAVTGPRFHFYENQHPAVEHDQVQLPHRAAIVALDQLVAFFLQVNLRQTLAFFAEELPAVIHDRRAGHDRPAEAKPRAPA